MPRRCFDGRQVLTIVLKSTEGNQVRPPEFWDYQGSLRSKIRSLE